MTQGQSRVETLKNAGFKIHPSLPDTHVEVIESLSDDELRVLIDVKQRLEQADSDTGADVGAYQEFFVPF